MGVLNRLLVHMVFLDFEGLSGQRHDLNSISDDEYCNLIICVEGEFPKGCLRHKWLILFLR